MNYLLQEISLYLLVTFVVGALYGWIVRSLRAKQDNKQYEDQNNRRLEEHEQALQALRAENESLLNRIEQLEFLPASGGEEDWQDEYSLDVIRDIESSTLKKLNDLNISTTKTTMEAMWFR